MSRGALPSTPATERSGMSSPVGADAASPKSTTSSTASSGGSWVAGRGAQLHDDMNLVILLGISLTAMVAMALHAARLQYGLTVFAVAYMVLDGLWILTNMASVKSPRTVLGHHLATLAVLADPLLQPQHAFYTCCALLVECNTFLLIARRRFAWGASAAVEVPFVLSWVALRLLWYPFLAYYMLLCVAPRALRDVYPPALVSWRVRVENGDPVPMFAGSYAAWVGICAFQAWWSMALFRNYSAKRKANGRNSAKYL